MRRSARSVALAVALLAAAAAGLAVGAHTAHRGTQTAVAHVGVRPRAVTPAPEPASAPTAADGGWLDRGSFARAVEAVGRAAGAQVGAFVRPLDGQPAAQAGALQSGPAWSTIKAPLVLTRYELAPAAGDARVAALAGKALTASDNDAAQALFDDIAARTGGVVAGSLAVERTLRAAGDETTRVNAVKTRPEFSTYGQTQWSLAAGTRFYAALARGCLPPVDADVRIAQWMQEVIPSQRWGLGSVAPPSGSTVAFKGGWGPDPDGRYLVRQFGFIRADEGSGVAIGVMARPADGAFASGTAVLDRLAAATVAEIRWRSLSPPGPC